MAKNKSIAFFLYLGLGKTSGTTLARILQPTHTTSCMAGGGDGGGGGLMEGTNVGSREEEEGRQGGRKRKGKERKVRQGRGRGWCGLLLLLVFFIGVNSQCLLSGPLRVDSA